MSKRRTKQDKVTAKHTYVYSPQSTELPSRLENRKVVTTFMGYDTALVIADLKKTLLLSAIILIAELLLYRFL